MIPEWLLQLEKGYLLHDPVETENIKSHAERQREVDEQFWREIGDWNRARELEEEDEDRDDPGPEEWSGERNPASLPYPEFLKSRYWRWLSAMLKAAVNWTCEICSERLLQGLQVHHKTYAHRGYEYPDHLDDLEVLCGDCHQRRHGLKGEV